MRLPVVQGVIRRRLLVNYRVEADVVRRRLPGPSRPKLQGGFAVTGIWPYPLEAERPAGLPGARGLARENAAHRIAVEWDGADGLPREGVLGVRRDTDSRLNALGGGRLFPGEPRLARLAVADDGAAVALSTVAERAEARRELDPGA